MLNITSSVEYDSKNHRVKTIFYKIFIDDVYTGLNKVTTTKFKVIFLISFYKKFLEILYFLFWVHRSFL